MAEPINSKAFTADVDKKMQATVEAMKRDFGAVRTGKASTAMLDGVIVDYYGNPTRLKDMASVTAPEPRLLVVQPWDQTAVKSIEKAIIASDLGISPMSDGRVVRLPVPELSEERRHALAKQVRERAEKGRIAIRDVRRIANEQLKKAEKDGLATEDEGKRLIAEVQKLTDRHIEEINKLTAAKEAELMAV